jgi:hypothetical protein
MTLETKYKLQKNCINRIKINKKKQIFFFKKKKYKTLNE